MVGSNTFKWRDNTDLSNYFIFVNRNKQIKYERTRRWRRVIIEIKNKFHYPIVSAMDDVIHHFNARLPQNEKLIACLMGLGIDNKCSEDR